MIKQLNTYILKQTFALLNIYDWIGKEIFVSVSDSEEREEKKTNSQHIGDFNVLM